MKHILKIAVLTPVAALLFLMEVPPELSPPYVQLVPEADAIFGVRRRSFRRGVIVGASIGAAEASANSASQQQSATAQQQSATARQPTGSGAKLPEGTVVTSLPAGCTPTQIGGIQYQHCGANYYRAAFQGNNLVYVITQP